MDERPERKLSVPVGPALLKPFILHVELAINFDRRRVPAYLTKTHERAGP